MTPRHTLARALIELPEAELTVLAYVADGLLTGWGRYGPLYAGKRNWWKEAAEEHRDAVVYLLADAMERAGLLPPQKEK